MKIVSLGIKDCLNGNWRFTGGFVFVAKTKAGSQAVLCENRNCSFGVFLSAAESFAFLI